MFAFKNYKHFRAMYCHLVWHITAFKVYWPTNRKYNQKITYNNSLYHFIYSLQYFTYRNLDLHFNTIFEWWIQKWMLGISTSLFLYKVVRLGLWKYDCWWNSCFLYFRNPCCFAHNKKFQKQGKLKKYFLNLILLFYFIFSFENFLNYIKILV
jgi:hypothetical protein